MTAPLALPFRVGHGWDSHRRDLNHPKPLRLGGFELAPTGGCLAHSDGDVLLHALIDALLGAMAWGDIGTWFPESDPKWSGADSRPWLLQTLRRLKIVGWQVAQVDCTLILESPKIRPVHMKLLQSLGRLLDLPLDRIGLKAKTPEGFETCLASPTIVASVVALLLPLSCSPEPRSL